LANIGSGSDTGRDGQPGRLLLTVARQGILCSRIPARRLSDSNQKLRKTVDTLRESVVPALEINWISPFSSRCVHPSVNCTPETNSALSSYPVNIFSSRAGVLEPLDAPLRRPAAAIFDGKMTACSCLESLADSFSRAMRRLP
jgi:hypothetical protein